MLKSKKKSLFTISLIFVSLIVTFLAVFTPFKRNVVNADEVIPASSFVGSYFNIYQSYKVNMNDGYVDAMNESYSIWDLSTKYDDYYGSFEINASPSVYAYTSNRLNFSPHNDYDAEVIDVKLDYIMNDYLLDVFIYDYDPSALYSFGASNSKLQFHYTIDYSSSYNFINLNTNCLFSPTVQKARFYYYDLDNVGGCFGVYANSVDWIYNNRVTKTVVTNADLTNPSAVVNVAGGSDDVETPSMTFTPNFWEHYGGNDLNGVMFYIYSDSDLTLANSTPYFDSSKIIGVRFFDWQHAPSDYINSYSSVDITDASGYFDYDSFESIIQISNVVDYFTSDGYHFCYLTSSIGTSTTLSYDGLGAFNSLRTYYFVDGSNMPTEIADARAQGYDVGYSEGNNAGYERGYNVGNSYGYERGYSVGENTGYSMGVANANNYSFIGLIGAVIDAPIQALVGKYNPNTGTREGGLLNFEILGVNLSAFFYSLFSITLIIVIIRHIKGGGSQ